MATKKKVEDKPKPKPKAKKTPPWKEKPKIKEQWIAIERLTAVISDGSMHPIELQQNTVTKEIRTIQI